MKKVAIITVGYNSMKNLPDYLASLGKQNFSDFKLVFVDNNSNDFSIDHVSKNMPDAKLIQTGSNLGFTGGNNFGIEYALEKNFDYVYLLNDDTVVDENFLTEAMKVAESDEKIGIVQSRIMLYPEKDKINTLGNELHYLGFGYSHGEDMALDELKTYKSEEITYASGAGMLIKAEVFKKIGLLADFWMYHEDVEFSWRARLAGYKIKLAYDSVVYHKYHFAKSIKQYYWMERNRFITIFTCYKIKSILLILPMFVLEDCGMLFFGLINGWLLHKLKVYIYFFKFSSWRKIIETRKVIKSYRLAKDKDIVRYFTPVVKFQKIDNPILKYFGNPLMALYWKIVRPLIIW